MSRHLFSRKTINVARPLAALLVVGAVLVPHIVSATTESSGATTEKQQLAQVQTRASSETSRRLNALNAVLPLITKLGNVSTSQQKVYTTAVNQQIKNLQSSNTEINGDATLAAATTDARKLDTEYATFMVLVPKVHLVITADDQQLLEAKFTTESNKMQDRLNTANNQGKDISAAQITLNDMLAHVQTAQGLSDTVAKAVPPIELGQYDANHAVLVSYYNQLKTAQDNLNAALNDAKTLLGEMPQF